MTYVLLFCGWKVNLIFHLQIEILLVKTEKFEELMAAEAEEKEFAVDGEEQNWARWLWLWPAIDNEHQSSIFRT